MRGHLGTREQAGLKRRDDLCEVRIHRVVRETLKCFDLRRELRFPLRQGRPVLFAEPG